jgi:hypothetical protein
MNHLIQPILIDGALRCPTSASGYRSTEGFATLTYAISGNTADPSTDPWTLAVVDGGYVYSEGEITFGVTCGNLVTINFSSADDSTSPNYEVEIYIYGEGIEIGPIILAEGTPNATGIEIELADAPCGELLAIWATVNRGGAAGEFEGTLTVTATITAIT